MKRRLARLLMRRETVDAATMLSMVGAAAILSSIHPALGIVWLTWSMVLPWMPPHG